MGHDTETELARARWAVAWAECWRLLLDLFPNSKPSERGEGLYAERLTDIPAETLRAAVEECAAASKFFPTIAEIRERAGAVRADREPVPLDVYGDTMRELSLARAENRVPVLDPIAKEVVAAMGGSLTLLISENGPLDRAHFTKAYEQKVAQERRIGSVCPKARELVPAPEPRRALEAVGRIALPEPEQPESVPLTTTEAAALIREVRERERAERDARMIGFSPKRVERPVAAGAITCPDCSLSYSTLYAECPRCRIRRSRAPGDGDAA